MEGEFVLVADERERNPIALIKVELEKVQNPPPFEVKTLTVGDYAIIRRTERGDDILAIIERKTHTDFESSMKDGRYDNKQKMIAARNATNARLYYIIEGKFGLNPADKGCNGDTGAKRANRTRIPYKNIESAMFHMMQRDNIFTIETEGISHTVRRLFSMCEYFSTINPADVVSEGHGAIEGGDIIATSAYSVVLCAKQVTPDDSVVSSMWSCIQGVNVISSSVLMKNFTIADYLSGKITNDSVKDIKMPSGRRFSEKTKKQITTTDKRTSERMISQIKGITDATAKLVIAHAINLGGIDKICEMGAEDMSNIDITRKPTASDAKPPPKRRLGAKANDIIRIINIGGKEETQD